MSNSSNWSVFADEPASQTPVTEESTRNNNADTGAQSSGSSGQEEKNSDNSSSKAAKTELLICDGASCVCDQAKSPAPIKLKVVSQQKYYINDADGSKKLIATVDDKDITSLNFSQCKIPDPSKPVACTTSLQWQQFYESMEVAGLKVLTEKSIGMCSKGGKVTVKLNGQEQTVSQQHREDALAATAPAVNAAVSEADIVISEAGSDANEDGAGVKKIKLDTPQVSTDGSLSYPPGSALSFSVEAFSKSNPTAAEKQAVDWIIYDAGSGQPVTVRHDIGTAMNAAFKKTGTYLVEAYGKKPGSTDPKARKQSAFKEITIRENTLSGIKGDKTVRIGEAVRFSAGTLFSSDQFPLAGEVSWQVRGNKTNPVLSNTSGNSTSVTCAEAGTYTVTAMYNGQQQVFGPVKVMRNVIQKVSADKSTAKINEPITFDVSKNFAINPPTADEIAAVKWLCVDEKGGEHPNAVQNGRATFQAMLGTPGQYTMYAYLRGKSEDVSWKFKVVAPTLTKASWTFPDRTPKSGTGWDEKSFMLMEFEACDNMKVEVTIGVHNLRNDQWVTISKPATFEIKNNELFLEFILKKDGNRERVFEGDELYFKIRSLDSKTPIKNETAAQPVRKLKVSSKERIEKSGFYEGGKPVTKVSFGATVECRIYVRNMNKVLAKIYKVLGSGGKDELVYNKEHEVGGDGYVSFPFEVKKDWEKQKNIMSFQIGVSEAGTGSGMLIAMRQFTGSKEGITTVGIQRVPPTKPATTTGPCVCQKYDLIWGKKVSCEFRKKVVEICAALWGEDRKIEMANGLMAVMNVETGGSFKAHQIMGQNLKSVSSITKDDFAQKNKEGKIISSRAVGLIQFTQAALTALGEFTSGSGYDKLHEVKLTFAKMGEIKQLDYVKKYFELDKANEKIKSPGDIYLHVFAPAGVGQKDDFVLYDSGRDYTENKSVDTGGNNDGKIQRSEILSRYNSSKVQGEGNKAIIKRCVNDLKYNAADVITYRIYWDGVIEKHIPKKIKEGFTEKYKYVYHDKDKGEHELGTFTYYKTKEMNPGNKKGDEDVELLDARQFKGYSSDKVKLKFITWNSDSQRWYINPDCFAGLLGAMGALNIDYLGFNGFSDNKAQSVGGSSSHRNGMKGDLRYLSTNKNGEATLLQSEHFDYDMQVKFNNELFNFGWGILEDMYSEKFTRDKKEVLLPHTKHMRKDGAKGYRHHHHLHLSGFDASTVIKIKE